MRWMKKPLTVIPDRVEFTDGIIYIISRKANDYDIDVLIQVEEYNDPITLSDILDKYPNVKKLIYESTLRGAVYNYENHKGCGWEMVGATIGYS